MYGKCSFAKSRVLTTTIFYLRIFSALRPHFTIASSQSSSRSSSPLSFRSVKRSNQTLYDAVAGNSREDRFLNPPLIDNRSGRRATSRAVPPETVLTCRWRRNRQNTHGAEEREDEDENDELDDILLNDDDDVKMMQAGLLVPSERNDALPDSDLLEAVHQYVSDFYRGQGLEEVCSRQFDETALLAMGIVIEELVNDCLGMDGHNVFAEQNVEQVDDDKDESDGSVNMGTVNTGARNGQLDLEDGENTDGALEDEESLDDELSDY